MTLWARARILQRRVLSRLGRQRSRRAGFDDVRSRFYRALWERAASAVGASLECLDRDVLRIVKSDRWTLVCRSDVMLDSHLAVAVAADKAMVLRLMQDAGFPTPRHLLFGLSSLERASLFMQQHGGAVVVKPASGTGAGQGVTTGVRDAGSLREASLQAAGYLDAPLLVEQQLAGSSFRLLYIGGRYVDAVRRDPPTVEGDGRRTVRELMELATEERQGGGEIVSLHPLDLDLDSRLFLGESGLTAESQLRKGHRLAVKRVVNQNAASDNHVVRDQVHPSIVNRGAEIVSYFGLHIAGVDLMCSDITRPIEEADASFNEINALPGLHHHVLVAEPRERVPVAEILLERLLSSSPARLTQGWSARTPSAAGPDPSLASSRARGNTR